MNQWVVRPAAAAAAVAVDAAAVGSPDLSGPC